MRIKVALLFSALMLCTGGFTAAGATLVPQQGEYTPYDYSGWLIKCRTRTNDKNVKQIKWAPVYQMSGDENHQANKVFMKVQVHPADGRDKSAPWTTGKKAAVTPGEPFMKSRRVWTPWVGVKKERRLLVHLIWHRTKELGNYVVDLSLGDLPTADDPDCTAV